MTKPEPPRGPPAPNDPKWLAKWVAYQDGRLQDLEEERDETRRWVARLAVLLGVSPVEFKLPPTLENEAEHYAELRDL